MSATSRPVRSRERAPFVGHIEQLARANSYYRRVLYTPKHLQLVLMSIGPGEEIGREVHRHTDQFFRIEKGEALFIFGREAEHVARGRSGDAIIVPAGTWHNVVNPSRTRPLKLYTIYAPPHHAAEAIARVKPRERSRARR